MRHFYGHYVDVLDLMDHMVQEMYGDFMGVFLADERLHMKEGFLRLFTYIREHREFFRNYINLSWRRNHRAKILPERLEEGLDRIIRDFGYRPEEELLYHQIFFTGALFLGVGMCLVMISGLMVQGIVVGIIGIVLLLCLIPVIKGLE